MYNRVSPTILNQDSSLKLLPCGTKKSKVFAMWPLESDDYLRKTIHSIAIETNPHLTEKAAKNRKRLTRREMEKLIEVLGPPKGYQNRFM